MSPAPLSSQLVEDGLILASVVSPELRSRFGVAPDAELVEVSAFLAAEEGEDLFVELRDLAELAISVPFSEDSAWTIIEAIRRWDTFLVMSRRSLYLPTVEIAS